MHSRIHIVCRDKTCGMFFLWCLSRWNEKDNIFSHTGWQESALHTLWHPEGRTMHLWQHASVQQNDAIPNLLPSWCKLGAGWSMCNIQWKNKSVNTCLIYSSPFLLLLFALPSSFVSVAPCASPLMFETTSFLCVRARVWMASSRDRLPNVCVFNDLISE